MILFKKISIIALFVLIFVIQEDNILYAGKTVNLSLDTAVEIAMKNSYGIRQLELGIERARLWLKAERAALKSKVFMNLSAPEIDAVSEYKWNSTIRKNEIIRQNTRRWQAELSIKQPVILFGYPTNGYLSLNNRTYRYLQKEDGIEDVDYYNRLFLKFEQPIFRPNELKNDIDNSELDVRAQELSNIRDRVNLANSISNEFFTLYGLAHRDAVLRRQVRSLERIYDIAQSSTHQDTTRKIDEVRARIELSNAREQQLKNLSNLRLQRLRMKQRLRIDTSDSLKIENILAVKEIHIDYDRALQHCFTLRPHLQLMKIEKKRREIQLDNARGWDSFHMNLAVTFGLEKNHDRYQALFEEYDNSYSVSLNAYIPLWDWGRQKDWIGAENASVKRAELNIEENIDYVKNSLNDTLTNLEDYQRRALSLKENLVMAQNICNMSIQQYKDIKIPLNDVLHIVERLRETEFNFLDAYLGYRRSLQELKSFTFYDYENNISMIDKYKPGS